MKVFLAGAFATLVSGMALAQSAPPGSAALSFEVASVKQHPIPQGMMRRPWSPNVDCGPMAECGVHGNRFTEVASLVDLLMDAYGLRRYQVSGLPSWGDSGHDIYDLDARMAGEHPTLEQARRMLQTLLADRFKLKVHHETKELPVYALVIGKNGSKLKPTDKPCKLPAPPGQSDGDGGRGGLKGGGGGVAPGGGLTLLNSWALMSEMISQFGERPVVDKTGLTAEAYCTLDGFDPVASVVIQLLSSGAGRGGGAPPPDRGDSGGASLFTLIEEKWGMKLEPQKGAVDLLVIDHVERPSEN